MENKIMEFSQPLIPGFFVQREKRFRVQVQLDSGEKVWVHCPNTGSMEGLLNPGESVWLSHQPSPKRKYPYTLEMVLPPSLEKNAVPCWVGVNTANPMKIFKEAFQDKRLPFLQEYHALKAEIKVSEHTRLDFLATGVGQPDCYIEIKNVHFSHGRVAFFPDSVTARGTKHLDTLAAMAACGEVKAMMCYVVQRGDVDACGVAGFMDELYGKAFEKAFQQGVQFYGLGCHVCAHEIVFQKLLPVLSPVYWDPRGERQ